MNIYLGNLPLTATETQLRDLFSSHGEVESVNLITDRHTGQLRGFGFIEMAIGGEQAIEVLNGVELGGQNLNVNEAKPRTRPGDRHK